MKLATFSVSNYRSITTAYKVSLGDYAILVGPNNEGKSNILRAIAVALNLLAQDAPYVARRAFRLRHSRYIRHERFDYVWKRDYPVALQESTPDGRSTFQLEFLLTPQELSEFNRATSAGLASMLKVRICANERQTTREVVIQGKAKTHFASRMREVCAFIANHLIVQYIPSIRPATLAIEVIDDLIALQLEAFAQNPAIIKVHKKILAHQQTLFDAIGKQLTTTVAQFIPGLRSITVRPGQGPLLHPGDVTVTVDDGNPTDLSSKGDGMQSLAAISLLQHATKMSLGDKALILAIEEPELHLHPKAIHHIRQILHSIAQSHQVIITTHSPVLVDRSTITNNILVQDNRAARASSLGQLRQSLGVALSDNLASADLILLTEGGEERPLLEKWLSLRSSRLASALKRGVLALDDLGGASNLSYKAGLYKTLLCNVHAFLDDDDAGRRAVDKAISAGSVTQAEYNLASRRSAPQSEIEDLLTPSTYVAAVKKEFGVNLDSPSMRGHDAKWSDRAKRCFRENGKKWSDQVERRLKAIACVRGASLGLDSLNRNHRRVVDALVESLMRRLGQA